MRTWLAVVDRTAVLFLGLAAGAAIGLAFGGPAIRAPAPIVPAPLTAATAPPPPATLGGPAATPAAAPAPECALPFQQQLLTTVSEGRPVRVGVFGDSFGDGVWTGLQRLLPAKAGFDVVKFSQQATGFTRYKSLNLETHAREQLGAAPIDVAVVSYGANDTQGIIDRDGHYAALMSPGWQREVGLRVDGFVRVLRTHGAIVYWVGLPRMRKDSFDADIADMNAFYQAKMQALGVPFVDTRPIASDAQGRYAPYLPDPNDGHAVLMRADDGIHMSMNGYLWITRGLAARIRAYVDAARVVAGVVPAAPVASAPPAPPPARPQPPRDAADRAPHPLEAAPSDRARAASPRAAATDRPSRPRATPADKPARPAAADRPATSAAAATDRPSRPRATPADKPARPAAADRPATSAAAAADRPSRPRATPADKPARPAAADRPADPPGASTDRASRPPAADRPPRAQPAPAEKPSRPPDARRPATPAPARPAAPKPAPDPA